MKSLILILALATMAAAQTRTDRMVISVDSSGNAHIPSGWKKITVEVEGRTYTIESKEVIENWRGRIYWDSLKVDTLGRFPYVPYKRKLITVPNYLRKVSL